MAKLTNVLWALLLAHAGVAYAQVAPPIPEPDPRYKVDILVIVGHPDDDIEVAAYLAKIIEQQHKRVGVVYATRGNSGGNAAGQEQANALADVREMEARHSLASYGVTLAWFFARRFPETRGVLMSADKSPELREACEGAGAFDFVHKENFRQEFGAVLERVCNTSLAIHM